MLPSSTRRDTSVCSSRIRRARRCREVTYLPSRPAKGESLTEKVTATVGSETLTKGRGSTRSGGHIVSPMLMSGMPDTATISPTVALSHSMRFRPWKV